MKTFVPIALAFLLAANSYAQNPRYDGELQGDPTFNDVRIKVQDDIDIPGEEEGVLIELLVREGSRVQKGDIIGRIDDRMPQAQLKVAEFSLEAARARADDKIEERYATKAADVAKTDYQKSLQAVRQTRDSVSEIELRRKKLDAERAELQIEKAQKDQFLAGKDADVKQAELDAAKMAVDRRVIRAPFAGDVQTLYKHQSEWLNPGEPILRLHNLETMQAECFVDSAEFDPVDVARKPVTVRVNLARNRQVSFQGRLIYVSQSVQSDGQYLVRAEFTNEREGDFWLVSPGLQASMTIHVSQTATKAIEAAVK